MNHATGRFVVRAQDNSEFAELSRDFNPLHVDETYARRLQFGSAVVHGVHHLLRALDHGFAAAGALTAASIHDLSVSFPNPVRVGKPVDYRLGLTEDSSRAELVATCGGARVLSAMIRIGAPLERTSRDCTPPRTNCRHERPVEQSFPPSHARGRVPAELDAEHARQMFPHLTESWGTGRLAQVLACTYVVGMKCPGLNSVFSGLELEFKEPLTGESTGAYLDYQVTHLDKRFQLVRIAVAGGEVEGTLDAFFRPGPTAQIAFSEALDVATADEFADQRALIVGGSRGIGEATAKILAAGGADVTITYRAGRGDALRVARDITDGGGACSVLELDVCGEIAPALERLGDSPDHVYYFASPHIEMSRGSHWNTDLFANFARYYLSAFSDLVDAVMALRGKAAPTMFFYPSSIYIEKPKKGFEAYAVAKAAGEALCRQLASRYRSAQFLAPRLPRMSTDQTASIIDLQSDSAFDVMSRELRRSHASRD